MKSCIILCSLVIIFCSIGIGCSYTDANSRLHELIRLSMHKREQSVLLSALRHHSSTRSTTISTSVEMGESDEVEEREAWDSGEDQYFRWASLNRRPMESLGRKRLAEILESISRPVRTKSHRRRSILAG